MTPWPVVSGQCGWWSVNSVADVQQVRATGGQQIRANKGGEQVNNNDDNNNNTITVIIGKNNNNNNNNKA